MIQRRIMRIFARIDIGHISSNGGISKLMSIVLFTELFPIQPDSIPTVTAYHLHSDIELDIAPICKRLQSAFGGRWIPAQDHIITDAEIPSIQLDITLDTLKQENETYHSLSINQLNVPSPQHIATFIIKTQAQILIPEINQQLRRYIITLENAQLIPVPVMTPYAVGNESAIALKVAFTVQTDKKFIAIHATDTLIEAGINPAHVQDALRLPTSTRAEQIKVISDRLKQANLIASAYNSRTHDESFAILDYLPDIEFGKNRVQPYKETDLHHDFSKYGVYQAHNRFQDAPIRIAVINTLDDLTKDFVEAMRRQLEKEFNFRIEMIKQRNIRKLTAKNIESAVRAVQKEKAHIVLAFFPDQTPADTSAQHLKNQTVGRGMTSHVVYESTMHNPDAMAQIIMSVLSKTANTPFILAEPLTYTDFVVGFDLVRQSLKAFDRITAITRIYNAQGQFVHYYMEQVEVDTGDNIPFVILQTLFPQDLFSNKRIIVHHHGDLSANMTHALSRWATVLQADIAPVSINRQYIPSIFRLENGVQFAKWGSVFWLNHHQAVVMASHQDIERPAEPMLVTSQILPIEDAVYSVLAWTILHYTGTDAKLPVTLQGSDRIVDWMEKGQLPTTTSGDVPFWL